jgi:hypothetical protein
MSQISARKKGRKVTSFLHGKLQKGQQMLWAELYKWYEMYQGNKKKLVRSRIERFQSQEK